MPDLSRRPCKLCDRPDFDDPAFVEAARSIVPERDPHDYVERKVWEFAMLALYLEGAGALREDAEVLAVGAGTERILFWLASRVGRVVATDIYGAGPFAGREAPSEMLADPASQAPYPYPRERLEVRWMDGRALEFADASFDVVFSLSSIEHFGGPGDVARAARELGRVLRPGGHAFVVTDCLVRRHPLDAAPADFARRVATLGRRFRSATPRRRARLGEAFTPRELERLIVHPSGLSLAAPFDTSLSPETWDEVIDVGRDHPEPRAEPGRQLILLRAGRSIFTSASLALRKPL